MLWFGSMAHVTVRYDVPVAADEWTLPEVPVPESVAHRVIVEFLAALLRAWLVRCGRNAFVAENLAFRWDEGRPRVGVDPDVCLIEPAPPDPGKLQSLRLWVPGHSPPRLAIEVVSRNHPYKDYAVVPDKYAASGTTELWVLDPELIGPRHRGGPVRLQRWTRAPDASFVRDYAGQGPMYSELLGAWVFAHTDGSGFRIAEDEACKAWWLTAEESALAAAEAARSDELAALQRIAELEAELARLKRR